MSKNEVIQQRMDTMAEMSRVENRGRQEMLQLWEKTVKQMADRDADFTELLKVRKMGTNVHTLTWITSAYNQPFFPKRNTMSSYRI